MLKETAQAIFALWVCSWIGVRWFKYSRSLIFSTYYKAIQHYHINACIPAGLRYRILYKIRWYSVSNFNPHCRHRVTPPSVGTSPCSCEVVQHSLQLTCLVFTMLQMYLLLLFIPHCHFNCISLNKARQLLFSWPHEILDISKVT